jgi:hypothetical protein
MRLSGVFLLSTTADLQARADILEPYRDRFRMSLVSNWSYYIAVNLYNNEDIMPQFSDQIMMLAQFLGPANVYFSAFENGSTDKTREALRSLELRLATAGVGYNIAMGEGDWRSFCNDISEEAVKFQCNTAVCTSLRRCPVPVRIAVMAAIRNKALEPLLDAAHARGSVPLRVDAVAHGPGRPAGHAAGRASGTPKRVSGGDAAGADAAHHVTLPDHGRGRGPAAAAVEGAAAGDATGGDGGDERGWEEAAEAMLLEEEEHAQLQGDRADRWPADASAFPVSDAVSASKALGRLLMELGAEAGGPAPAPAAVGSPRHTWTGQGHGSADAADAEHDAGDGQEHASPVLHRRSGGGGSGERHSVSPVHPQNYAAEIRVASSRAGATGSNPFGAGTLKAGPGGLWGISSRRAAAPHLGLSNPVMVIFLNDVLLYAEDVVELLLTEDGHYDMACGMDFEQLKLYDTWVARDMSGATFSDWYPFLREGTAQALMRQNKPFRVFSCWNGGVVVPAAYILRDRILFRTWRPSEVRSLHPNANKNEVSWLRGGCASVAGAGSRGAAWLRLFSDVNSMLSRASPRSTLCRPPRNNCLICPPRPELCTATARFLSLPSHSLACCRCSTRSAAPPPSACCSARTCGRQSTGAST